MRLPSLMFCVGATKAGTSWLYRYLHGHDEVALAAIKEAHFFDTIDFDDFEFQIGAFEDRVRDMKSAKATAEANGNIWKAENLSAQIADLERLISALRQGEEGLPAYLDYVFSQAGAGTRVVGDITPSYALLSQERLAMMAGLTDDVRIVYLMRDPVERLWSHVRMQAKRNCPPHKTLAQKSRGILKRVTHNQHEGHIMARGDYAAAVAKLKKAVPAEKLHIEFSERLYTEDGLRKLCHFLDITYKPGDMERRVHEGVQIELEDDMRGWAAEYLAPQYAYVEEHIGALPEAWQANRVRVS
ncbi:sulfotransferase [Celeribacter arenosi]|uniref:Sulfotransferase family protein n=1 Tax=Celeribacter arenosi TaxID=792649 RepID=A0ABP7KA65_9RHOB